MGGRFSFNGINSNNLEISVFIFGEIVSTSKSRALFVNFKFLQLNSKKFVAMFFKLSLSGSGKFISLPKLGISSMGEYLVHIKIIFLL